MSALKTQLAHLGAIVLGNSAALPPAPVTDSGDNTRWQLQLEMALFSD